MADNDDDDFDELGLDLNNNNSWFLGLEGWLATKQWKLSCGFPAAPFCRNNPGDGNNIHIFLDQLFIFLTNMISKDGILYNEELLSVSDNEDRCCPSDGNSICALSDITDYLLQQQLLVFRFEKLSCICCS